MRRLTLIAAAILACGLSLTGCDRDPYDKRQFVRPVVAGDPERGARLLQYYGCGGCHDIDRIPNAIGVVGPPLNGIGKRVYIVGMLRNSPGNLERWLQHPQAIVPGNVMPDLGVNRRDARDMTAYLYEHN